MEAIDRGNFNLWAIDSIDEGIEILTGMKAGDMEDGGTFPKGSVNRLVMEKLDHFNAVSKRTGNGNNGKDNN